MKDPLIQAHSLKDLGPQQRVWAGLHQDYSHRYVWEEIQEGKLPNEAEAGRIAVKALLKGDRGHYGCYSADTEVLTSQGWKFWPDVEKTDKLLAVDIQNGTAHFEVPSALQKKTGVRDSLYHVKSQYLDFMVTRDHRMIVSNRTTSGTFSDWHVRSASEVEGRPVRYLLNTCLSESNREPPDLPEGVDPLVAFKLAGFFFGDGLRSNNHTPNVVRFRIRRPRKIAYLLSLGLPAEPRAGDRYTVTHKPLAKWIHQHFSTENGKVMPAWILTLPEAMIAALWDGLKNSDGTRVTEKSWAYDSADKEQLDLIQATAHVNGYSANMTLNNPNEGEGHDSHRPCWRIHISEHSTRRVETGQKGRSPGVSESWVEYSGAVYCATVSTGALMVRRNNKVIVLGNCIEQSGLTVACGYIPHSVMQQLRTHRIAVTFDCQSFRYTSQGVIDAYEEAVRACDIETRNAAVERVVYLPPAGKYKDRHHPTYTYSEDHRLDDLEWCFRLMDRYSHRVSHQGFAPQHARGMLPFDYRQHFVLSFNNLRSLWHMADLRLKPDTQGEAQQTVQAIWDALVDEAPELNEWYAEVRLKKGRLAP